MRLCRECYGWRLCLVIFGLHIGLREAASPQERWERLWRDNPG